MSKELQQFDNIINVHVIQICPLATGGFQPMFFWQRGENHLASIGPLRFPLSFGNIAPEMMNALQTEFELPPGLLDTLLRRGQGGSHTRILKCAARDVAGQSKILLIAMPELYPFLQHKGTRQIAQTLHDRMIVKDSFPDSGDQSVNYVSFLIDVGYTVNVAIEMMERDELDGIKTTRATASILRLLKAWQKAGRGSDLVLEAYTGEAVNFWKRHGEHMRGVGGCKALHNSILMREEFLGDGERSVDSCIRVAFSSGTTPRDTEMRMLREILLGHFLETQSSYAHSILHEILPASVGRGICLVGHQVISGGGMGHAHGQNGANSMGGDMKDMTLQQVKDEAPFFLVGVIHLANQHVDLYGSEFSEVMQMKVGDVQTAVHTVFGQHRTASTGLTLQGSMTGDMRASLFDSFATVDRRDGSDYQVNPEQRVLGGENASAMSGLTLQGSMNGDMRASLFVAAAYVDRGDGGKYRSASSGISEMLYDLFPAGELSCQGACGYVFPRETYFHLLEGAYKLFCPRCTHINIVHKAHAFVAGSGAYGSTKALGSGSLPCTCKICWQGKGGCKGTYNPNGGQRGSSKGWCAGCGDGRHIQESLCGKRPGKK